MDERPSDFNSDLLLLTLTNCYTLLIQKAFKPKKNESVPVACVSGAEKERGGEEKLENDDWQLSKLSTSVRIKIWPYLNHSPPGILKLKLKPDGPFSGHCLTIKSQNCPETPL